MDKQENQYSLCGLIGLMIIVISLIYTVNSSHHTEPSHTIAVPTMAENYLWYKSTAPRSTVTKITFMDGYMPVTAVDETWTADVNGTGDITCYRTGTEVIVAGNGTGRIKANTDSSYMFSSPSDSCFSNLVEIQNLDLLDTAGTTNMDHMFGSCFSLLHMDLNHFDTARVTSMYSMFVNCCSLTSLDLHNFVTSNVTDMSRMFAICTSLTALDLSHFSTKQATNMYGMFINCSSLTELNLSSFATAQVANMSNMFCNCTSLHTVYVSEKWDTNQVTNSSGMFAECINLQGELSFDSEYIDKTYAQTPAEYLTRKNV